KWPLAMDLVKRQCDALFTGHFMETVTEAFNVAPTARLGAFGVTGYLTTDPENLKTVLTTRFKDYSLGIRRDAVMPLLGEGIFGQDGPAWQRSRSIIQQQFIRVQRQTLKVFVPHVNKLISGMSDASRASENGVIDLRPFFFDYTLDNTAALLFGEPQSSMPTKERNALTENFDFASMGVSIRLRLAGLAPLYRSRKFAESCKVVKEWASFFSKKALAYMDEVGEEKAAAKYPFIVDLWKEMGDADLVRDQLLHILLAGRDSTASLLCWTLFHLLRNPAILDKLRNEISHLDKEEILSREQIQKLPFLRCCLNETLRLYPTLTLNVRFANKNTILPRGGGSDGQAPVLLLKGTGIGWSAYHLHRLESIYGADAKVYRPDRWADGELMRKNLGSGFIDFNAGPRTCLGKDFALMEASYAVIRILQSFPNIHLPPGTHIEPAGAERQLYGIIVTPMDEVGAVLQ
ncbi:n-alkane-inducible cytochrome P450, partial [Cryphonectria parasitica EP155]